MLHHYHKIHSAHVDDSGFHSASSSPALKCYQTSKATAYRYFIEHNIDFLRESWLDIDRDFICSAAERDEMGRVYIHA